ncbi:phage tail protein [Anaeromusa acidaminophila]|uniref:phage tail protein n=1 Tax=Anaeromusa acidaminophila TaxID=81464 RepID=UPI0008FC0131
MEGVWLECNGQSTAGYPSLATIVGSNVPNYQGLFLRGYGSQLFTDIYGTVNHSSLSMGVIQGDSSRNAEGSFLGDDSVTGYSGYTPIGAPSPTGVFSTGAAYNFDLQNNGSGNGHIIKFSLKNVMPTDNENRPLNTAVKFLIRAK